MPHCQMLHSNLAVAWNLNGGNSLTVELIANIDVTDYVAFGFSKKGASKMVGSDVAIAYKDGLLGMAIRVVKFSSGVYKFGQIFAYIMLLPCHKKTYLMKSRS